MTTEEVVKTLVTFLLGLLAKVIYDIWAERRKKKAIILRKSVISAFNQSGLEEAIRKSTDVFYQGHKIESIQVVHVEVENSGKSAVRNQALTIRFSDQATILNVEPDSQTTSEDLRYVETDSQAAPNAKRYIIKLLRKDCRMGWNLTVINHNQSEFAVEHGVASTVAAETDLDVESLITSGKTRADLAKRVYRVILLLISIRVLALLQGILPVGFVDLAKPVFTLLIIGVWIFIIREVQELLVPLFNWLEDRKKTTSDWHVQQSGAGQIAIVVDTGRINSMTYSSPPAYESVEVPQIAPATDFSTKD